MRKEHATRGFSFAGRKTDLIFAIVALVLVVVMAVFLIRYLNLREQNRTPPEEYGIMLRDFDDVKAQKTALEYEIDSLTRELSELNERISSLSGN